MPETAYMQLFILNHQQPLHRLYVGLFILHLIQPTRIYAMDARPARIVNKSDWNYVLYSATTYL